jgi:hypothetical protein
MLLVEPCWGSIIANGVTRERALLQQLVSIGQLQSKDRCPWEVSFGFEALLQDGGLDAVFELMCGAGRSWRLSVL